MASYFEAGKGSIQRPEDHNNFSNNFDKIFGKKDKKVLTEQEDSLTLPPETQDQPSTD